MMNELLVLLPSRSNGDDTLFLGHFLTRLPVSMRDHLKTSDHKTAAAIAKHANTLFNARAGESKAPQSPPFLLRWKQSM